MPTQGALKPELFNRILRSVDGSEHQLFINEVVLRSQIAGRVRRPRITAISA